MANESGLNGRAVALRWGSCAEPVQAAQIACPAARALAQAHWKL